MAGVRTLAVRCPDWPVVASGHPATVPVAVVFANRVVACSEAARGEGVAVGLRRREAQGRCPELIVIEQDVGRDIRAFEPVVAAVESFTPGVEVGTPGEVSFATRGPSRYFGGDRSLAAQVAAAVDDVTARMELNAPPCRVGVADGPFAARLAARAATPGKSGPATPTATPGERGPAIPAATPGESGPAIPTARPGAPGPATPAVLVVPPGGSAAFLSPFPVHALDRPDLADLLRRLGLPTLGDLAALPAKTVLARFGADGAQAHRLARGLDERPLATRTPPPELAVVAELDPPAERVDMAMFVAKALADDLHELLSARGLACTRVAIEAETEHGERVVRLWRHDGALTSRAIAERVRWQLEGWLSTGATTAGVTLIRLTPDEIKPDHGRQLGFWGGSAAAHDRAARGFARVQGMLGPDGVVTAVVGGGRDPGVQVQLIPWGDPRPGADVARISGEYPRGASPGRNADVARLWCVYTPQSRATREVPPWPGQLPDPAPAVVYPDRIPAALCDGDGRPVLVDGRGAVASAPARLSIAAGPAAEVVAWAGPWPAEERWWDQESSRRRARFQVALADGTAHVVVLESGRWWVEATYD